MIATGIVKRKNRIMDFEPSKTQVQILVLLLVRCLITCKPIILSLQVPVSSPYKRDNNSIFPVSDGDTVPVM